MANPIIFKHIDTLKQAWQDVDESTKLEMLQVHYAELFDYIRKQEKFYAIGTRDLAVAITDKNNLLRELGMQDGKKHELFATYNRVREESFTQIREAKEKCKISMEKLEAELLQMRKTVATTNLENLQLVDRNKQLRTCLEKVKELIRCAKDKVKSIFLGANTNRYSNAHYAKELQNALNMKIEIPGEMENSEQEREQINSIEKGGGRKRPASTNESEAKKCKSQVDENKSSEQLAKDACHWCSSCFELLIKIQSLEVEIRKRERVVEEGTRREQKLMGLCRQLQADRRTYLDALRELSKNRDLLLEFINSNNINAGVLMPVITSITQNDLKDSDKLQAQPKHRVNGGKNNKKMRKRKLKQLQKNRDKRVKDGNLTQPQLTKEDREEVDRAFALMHTMEPPPLIKICDEPIDSKSSLTKDPQPSTATAEIEKISRLMNEPCVSFSEDDSVERFWYEPAEMSEGEDPVFHFEEEIQDLVISSSDCENDVEEDDEEGTPEINDEVDSNETTQLIISSSDSEEMIDADDEEGE